MGRGEGLADSSPPQSMIKNIKSLGWLSNPVFVWEYTWLVLVNHMFFTRFKKKISSTRIIFIALCTKNNVTII